ncbi:OmpP1/FadL family transporter [Treponema sp.]|uniref:OmpP1/FadL family transporter n=1 Tax=Treponema sp. TaxID=166 RepID=UPI00298D831C|nr:outer membrane protein transport protein [Treponema sp.]MCQ2240364.1 outer membrane protein transport protein [Treponema sp.]
MKKIFAFAVSVLATASVFAGGVDNKTNLSAGYERNPSRNTECSRPEAVFYNIGGTAFMEDGVYVEAGDQLVFKKYANKLDVAAFNTYGINKTYEDNRLVYLYPNAELVYKKGETAIFFGFGVFGGGGNLEYKDGTAATGLAFMGQALKYRNQAMTAAAGGDLQSAQRLAGAATACTGIASDHSLDVYSVQLGEIIGISSKVMDNLSLAVAARFMHGTQSIELKSASLKAINGGDDTVGYKADGYSVGAMFGIHYKPTELVDLSAQYQSITRLNYKYHSYTGKDEVISSIITNKKDSFANDLPAVLNLGFGYQVLEDLYASTSVNYYFNRFATIESPLDGSEYDYGNSWEIALGADYQLNRNLLLSAGISYGKNGTKSDQNNIFSPVLDSLAIGTGCEYKITDKVLFTGSIMYCKYFDQDYTISSYDTTLSKNVTLIALGVTYKPF